MKKVLLIPALLISGFWASAQVKEITVVGRPGSNNTETITVVGQPVDMIADTIIANDGDQKIITLRLKGDKAAEKKYVIEVDGEKIKINGKDISELKDVDVSINKNRLYLRGVTQPRPGAQSRVVVGRPLAGAHGLSGSSPFIEERIIREHANGPKKAMLGVGMEKVDNGVRITNVNEGTAAEKAGLQTGDIVTAISGKKVTTEMEMSNQIGSYKPGDEVEVTYLREGKEKKVKAKLGERKDEAMVFSSEPGGLNYMFRDGQTMPFQGNRELFERNLDFTFAEPFNQFNWSEGGPGAITVTGFARPQLGVNIKETESGKGLEVIEVSDESVAEKAGLKKGDIITEVGGKAVNSVEEIRKAVAESKDKPFNIQYTRNGKTNTVEVKFPKKLKEAKL